MPDDTKQLKQIIEEELTALRQLDESYSVIQGRATGLEAELEAKAAALDKLTQGTSLAKILAGMQAKFTAERSQQFESSKSRVEDLEKVIDQNTKLIKDLTETLQTRNAEVKTLKSEDLVKQARSTPCRRRLKRSKS